MAFKQLVSRIKHNYLFNMRHAYTKVPKNIGFKGYAILSVPIATFCLGTWQVKRRSWKLKLIEDVETRNKAPPIDLPDLGDLSDMEYVRVHVVGTYDHSREMYISPRQLVSNERDSKKSSGIMSSPAKSGYFVVTPFHVKDRNLTILVNRGWVSKENLDPSSRAEGQVNGEVELLGTVRLQEKKPPACPKRKPKSPFFLYRDVETMAAICGCEAVFLDADASSTVPGGPIGGQTRMSFRNDHMSYIITWYSLSTATAYMWYSKFLKISK